MKTYPKIHKACSDNESSPAFNYVFISKKVVKATDGHILIQYNLFDIFEMELMNSLPKKPILVHRLHFANMVRDGCEFHEIENKMIKYYYRKLWHYVPYLIEGEDMNYVNTDKVWPEGNIKPIDTIIINNRILKKVLEILPINRHTSIKYEFYGKNESIVITDSMDERAFKCLVMPMLQS